MFKRVLAKAACAFAAGVMSACGGGNGSIAAPVLTLTAAPAFLQSGQSTTLTWNASTASSCSASGSWSGEASVEGTQTLLLTEPGDYVFVLTCTGPGGSDTQAAFVTVSGSPGSNSIPVSLSANPTLVPVGQTTTLTWSSPDADSCTASGEWSGSKEVTGSEIVTVTHPGTSFYNLYCSGAGGSGSQQVAVTGSLPTLALTSDSDIVAAGGAVTLTWSSSDASACTASDGWSGSKPTAGSESLAIPAIDAYDFSLTCSDGSNSVTQTVTVNGSAPVVSLTVFPSTVVAGKTVTLRWQAQYADSCLASGVWNGSLPAAGARTVTLTGEGARNFHLACSNSGASTQGDASAVVTPAPAFPPATAYRMTESHDGVVVTTGAVTYPKSSAPDWTADLGAPVSYPLIADGMVFVASTNPDGSYGNRLYGLDATTGATVWGPVAVPGTYFGSGLTYDNGRVFILMFDGALRAYDASNGAALWNTQLPGYWYFGSPTAYGGIVFVVGNGGLSAVDEASGNILWTASGGTTDWVSPAVSSEGVYFMDGYDCRAGAFEPWTGTEFWQRTVQCNGPRGYTPAVKNGVFYGRAGGSIALFDTLTGDPDGQLASAVAPSITDTALIALNSGTLSATRLNDRAQSWTFTGDGQLATAPVVVNNTVFVGATSGNVYGVDAGTGEQTWLGVSPQPINENSENGGPMPPSGPAAGANLLIFPAGNSLVAWRFQ